MTISAEAAGNFTQVILKDFLLVQESNVNSIPILSSPASVELTIDNKKVHASARRDKPTFIVAPSKAYSIHDFEGVDLTIETTIDDTGLAVSSISVSASNNNKLNELKIHLPIRQEIGQYYSRYLDYTPRNGRFYRKNILETYGEVADAQTFRYSPSFWIGNTLAGIEFSLESNQHLLSFDKNPISVVKSGDTIELEITIAHDVQLSEKQTIFEFAILPTPVRSSTAQYDTLVFGDWNEPPGNLNTTSKYGILMLGNFPRSYPTVPTLEFSPGLSNANNRMPEDLFANKILGQGILPVPYSALHAVSAKLPGKIWEENKKNWRTGTDRRLDTTRHYYWQRAMGLGKQEPTAYLTDLADESLRDFLLKSTIDAIRKDGIRGIYFDFAMPFTVSRNPKSEYFSATKNGAFHFPLIDQYHFLKLLSERTKALDEEFRIICHASKLPVILSAYCDDVLAGEPMNVVFSHKPRSAAKTDPNAYIPDYFTLPEAYWIAEHGAGAYPSILLPQVSKWNREFIKRKENDHLFRTYSRKLIAQALHWNTRIYYAGLHREVLNGYIKILSNWNWHRRSTYLGPKTSHHLITWNISSNNQIQDSVTPSVALYVDEQTSKILVVATNSSKNGFKGSFVIDLEQLKRTISSSTGRMDAESTAHPTLHNNAITVPLQINANDASYFEMVL